jgi:hypothetical protein
VKGDVSATKDMERHHDPELCMGQTVSDLTGVGLNAMQTLAI